MLEFTSFHAAKKGLVGIELPHMIRNAWLNMNDCEGIIFFEKNFSLIEKTRPREK